MRVALEIEFDGRQFAGSQIQAGLRTFALVSMLGCLFARLREKTGGPWALMANLVFKIGLVIGIGGSKLARHALPGLIAIGTGMALGLLLF